MVYCALAITLTCISSYSIFVIFRFLNIHNIPISRYVFFRLKYFRASSEHLLNFNSALNPFLYILHNRSIRRTLRIGRRGRGGDDPGQKGGSRVSGGRSTGEMQQVCSTGNSVVLSRVTCSLREQRM